jgi:A/G-specific adenine glycosylase
MTRSDHIRAFVREIWTWYGFHKRKLPWRDLQISDPTERAYQVLVSEIMLQQTQVPRVIGAFRLFVERFPRLADLANAENREVLLIWRGMGYNSRALRLRDAAKIILERHAGVFPQSMEELRAIPGIGHYTAGAIRNFAFNIPTPCLDTNIRRVLHRTFIGPENPDGTWKKDDAYLLELAEDILHEAIKTGTTADWHAALMDFGSLVCTKRNPKWEICPLTRAGISKSSHKVVASIPKSAKQEPGRLVGSKFVPNRIFRGRIVEALRDEPAGLTPSQIGPRISVDWESAVHRAWLDGLLKKLVQDKLLRKAKSRFVLG